MDKEKIKETLNILGVSKAIDEDQIDKLLDTYATLPGVKKFFKGSSDDGAYTPANQYLSSIAQVLLETPPQFITSYEDLRRAIGGLFHQFITSLHSDIIFKRIKMDPNVVDGLAAQVEDLLNTDRLYKYWLLKLSSYNGFFWLFMSLLPAIFLGWQWYVVFLIIGFTASNLGMIALWRRTEPKRQLRIQYNELVVSKNLTHILKQFKALIENG